MQQAIESVLASCSEALQVEILLIDDGENDETKLIAHRYPLNYLRGPGRGVSAARNVGLREATGSYITFLDDDDTWPANNLMRQIRFLDENPSYGAVCSQVVLTDDAGEICSPPYPNPPFASGWMFNDFLSYIPQVGSLLVRHDIAMAVGDFDPNLQGGEDWDWALRLARICQIGFVAEVVLHWRMHNTARFDGAGNRRIEDITWRRYTDVMDVAHRHIEGGPPRSWLAKQRILLKHKGHYIPLFTRYAIGYARKGKLRQAAICYWLAIRISPLHIVSSTAKTALRQLQSNLSRLRASERLPR
ncbi:glycosyltransferase family 2 protein [Oscillochloris sp. ZM17-4]|nr:glycosyltransferase family 2 protein [Oscillochloris sp. ZM17-4]